MVSQELPPIVNFTPNQYKAENQNWAISQSNQKHIYVANSSGLLEYNGASWQLYPSTNNTIIRSVKAVNNRIYTGSYMEFGYWSKNKFGKLSYISLSANLTFPLIEDEQFWNILTLDNWVVFQSLNRLIIYNTVSNKFNAIESDTNLPKAFTVNNTLYYQKINDGIYKIENGKPQLVSNHPVFKNNIIVGISIHNEKLIFQTQEKGFYYFNKNNELVQWEIEANNLLSKISIYSSIQLQNNSIVIGTIANGIYHLSEDGKIIKNINHENGLNNNTVLSLFVDRDNNLWLGLDNGISVINFDSPYSVYHDFKGELGTVYTAAIFNNNLYLGTNQGLFYKKVDSNNGFKFIEGTKGQVWNLLVLKNTLFCGHNLGTFTIKNNKASLISSIMGTWHLTTVNSNPNLLLQGNYDGLYVLEKAKNTWKLKHKIDGFDFSSRNFEFVSKNKLFVNHEYKGVFSLTLSDDLKKVTSMKVEKSVPKGLKSSVVKYNNKLYYTSKDGIFNYNLKEDKFIKDTALTTNFLTDETYLTGKLIVEPQTNTLWGFTQKNIIYFSPGAFTNKPVITKISFPETHRKVITGYESLTHLKNKQYLVGTSYGYVIIDLKKFKSTDYTVEINSIQKSVLNKQKTNLQLNASGALKFKENNIYFNFNIPQFNKFTEVNYKYQLKGLYDEWTNWSSTSNASFKNLPYGNYVFNVKARTGNNENSNIATYSFTVNRPFTLSNSMLFLYVIMFIVLLFLIHSFYKRHYNRQKQKSLEKKQREFALSQLENRQKLMQLKNAQLNSEIESKNRELTLTTMSIIKKNEILNAIKKELVDTKTGESCKKVIKTIDKNLNDKKDWEFLEEAFNNADKDFLKKIKNIHPTLTPNDLRFCAYLRLNLSSKEIAPLLNISVRSVEIKRYRLRKKMQLPHEKSLVSYILSI